MQGGASRLLRCVYETVQGKLTASFTLPFPPPPLQLEQPKYILRMIGNHVTKMESWNSLAHINFSGESKPKAAASVMTREQVPNAPATHAGVGTSS